MYQRNQLLHKIQDETEKARSLLDARAQLQQQRKMANMGASFQRQKLLEAMDKLQTNKDKEWNSQHGQPAALTMRSRLSSAVFLSKWHDIWCGQPFGLTDSCVCCDVLSVTSESFAMPHFCVQQNWSEWP